MQIDVEIRKLGPSYVVEWYDWSTFKIGVKTFKTLREAEDFAHGKNEMYETPSHLVDLPHADDDGATKHHWNRKAH